MLEPIITCPTCGAEIRVTESLAAPLVEATRRQYEQRLADKEADVRAREAEIREKQVAVVEAQESLDAQIAARLEKERPVIAAEEANRARLNLSAEIELKTREVGDLQDALKQRETKLAEAQQAQVELMRKQRELDDALREVDLTVEKRLQESLTETREQGRKEAEEAMRLKVMEKEQTIISMQRQIEDLKRRAEQGSQQLQGEVLELELESLLRQRFPLDTIEPVPKGEHGGDLVQRVVGPGGLPAGTIIWETKRTKNWSDGWLPKLRDDQRAAKAEIAVLVTLALPKGVESFDQIEGVWVAHPSVLLPVALTLRQTLMEVASARRISEGQQTKMEMVYEYLTGPRFRQRIQAIVEAFGAMQSDLERERRMLIKQWEKRREQIDRVMQAAVGMYGDLQGIAGQSLQEIEGLELPPLLESPAANGDGE